MDGLWKLWSTNSKPIQGLTILHVIFLFLCNMNRKPMWFGRSKYYVSAMAVGPSRWNRSCDICDMTMRIIYFPMSFLFDTLECWMLKNNQYPNDLRLKSNFWWGAGNCISATFFGSLRLVKDWLYPHVLPRPDHDLACGELHERLGCHRLPPAMWQDFNKWLWINTYFYTIFRGLWTSINPS